MSRGRGAAGKSNAAAMAGWAEHLKSCIRCMMPSCEAHFFSHLGICLQVCGCKRAAVCSHLRPASGGATSGGCRRRAGHFLLGRWVMLVRVPAQAYLFPGTEPRCTAAVQVGMHKFLRCRHLSLRTAGCNPACFETEFSHQPCHAASQPAALPLYTSLFNTAPCPAGTSALNMLLNFGFVAEELR